MKKVDGQEIWFASSMNLGGDQVHLEYFEEAYEKRIWHQKLLCFKSAKAQAFLIM